MPDNMIMATRAQLRPLLAFTSRDPERWVLGFAHPYNLHGRLGLVASDGQRLGFIAGVYARGMPVPGARIPPWGTPWPRRNKPGRKASGGGLVPRVDAVEAVTDETQVADFKSARLPKFEQCFPDDRVAEHLQPKALIDLATAVAADALAVFADEQARAQPDVRRMRSRHYAPVVPFCGWHVQARFLLDAIALMGTAAYSVYVGPADSGHARAGVFIFDGSSGRTAVIMSCKPHDGLRT